MWNWVLQHASVVQAVIALVTAGVWIVYLHVFVESLRRQRRSEILITMGGERGLGGRVLISNLGLEPIYVLDILLGRSTDSAEDLVSVIDKTEGGASGSARGATLQRPLKSGEHIDIGTIDDLLDRAAWGPRRGRSDGDLSRIEITVAAVTAAASGIVAARRAFAVQHRDGQLILRPQTLYAEQIRGREGRRRIENQLAARL